MGWSLWILPEQVEIPIGTTCLDVFAHTNTVRASYKGLKPYDTDGTEWEVFADQYVLHEGPPSFCLGIWLWLIHSRVCISCVRMRTIFGILDVVSNFGVLQLNPDLFEPELKILTNTSYLNHAMYLMDFEVVAKFLQSMRIFGAAKAAELANTIFVTERFLLIKQLQDGSWLKAGGSFADQYKATAVCAKYVTAGKRCWSVVVVRGCVLTSPDPIHSCVISRALATPVFQGFGPASSDFHRLLEKWAKAAPFSKFPDLPNQKVLVSGVKVRPPTRANLKKLENFYKVCALVQVSLACVWAVGQVLSLTSCAAFSFQRHMVPDSEANALERLVTERLRKIFPSKVR